MQSCTARGEASLAADRSSAASGTAIAGSMSRPGKELGQNLEIVVSVDLVGWKNTEFASGLEKGDRDHQVAAKLESVD